MLATIENVIIVHNRRRRAKRDLATLNTFFFSLRWLFRQCHATSSSSGRCRSITECHTLFYNSNPTSIHLHRLSTFSLNVMKSPTRAHPFVAFPSVKCVQFAGECDATSRVQKFNNSSRKDFKMKLWEIACRLAALRTQKGKQIFFVAQSARPSRLWLIALFTIRFWQAREDFDMNVKFCRHFFISDVRQLQTAKKLCNAIINLGNWKTSEQQSWVGERKSRREKIKAAELKVRNNMKARR